MTGFGGATEIPRVSEQDRLNNPAYTCGPAGPVLFKDYGLAKWESET